MCLYSFIHPGSGDTVHVQLWLGKSPLQEARAGSTHRARARQPQQSSHQNLTTYHHTDMQQYDLVTVELYISQITFSC